MEPRIPVITLGVADLARSHRFCRKGLGLPATRKPEDGGYRGYLTGPDGYVWEVF
jgi:catechol 2,3-dioxygenase-like lactoylglutathione lyase family enzyme